MNTLCITEAFSKINVTAMLVFIGLYFKVVPTNVSEATACFASCARIGGHNSKYNSAKITGYGLMSTDVVFLSFFLLQEKSSVLMLWLQLCMHVIHLQYTISANSQCVLGIACVVHDEELSVCFEQTITTPNNLISPCKQHDYFSNVTICFTILTHCQSIPCCLRPFLYEKIAYWSAHAAVLHASNPSRP